MSRETSAYLNAGYRKERSWNNYKPDLLKSGLQKYIRRGLAAKAEFCAGELDLFKHAEGARGEGLRTNFLHRLMVIFLEDVGVGALGLWAALDGAMDALFAERKLAADKRSHAKEAGLIRSVVVALAAAQKSRSCSHVRAVAARDAMSRGLAAAKYPAIDALHATAGDVEAASFEEACLKFEAALVARCWTAVIWAQKIANSTEKVREYRKTKPVWRVFRILEKTLPATFPHALARKWYSELESMKECFLAWMVLIVAHVTNAPIVATELPALVVADDWSANKAGAVIEWDAFVEDRHTAAGRGKTLTEFALIGAHVENESPLVVVEHKAFYVEMKRLMDEKPKKKNPRKPKTVPAVPAVVAAGAAAKETEAYEFLVRAQVNTSASKSDVYFAREVATGALVVVKGPVKPEAVAQMLEMQKWKRTAGLPAVAARCVELIPDRWPEGVPLGLRNKVSRTAPATFLVCESLLDESALSNRLLHTTRVWPATEVMDWSKVANHITPAALAASDTAMCDYVAALCARWVFGVSDLADRNFLLLSGGSRVLSIDEEYRGKTVDFAKELKGKRCTLIRAWLSGGGYARLKTVLEVWEVPEAEKPRMAVLRDEAACMALFA